MAPAVAKPAAPDEVEVLVTLPTKPPAICVPVGDWNTLEASFGGLSE